MQVARRLLKIGQFVLSFYFQVDTLEGLLTAWEAFLQKWGLQVVKLCTQMQMKHKVFGSADVCSSERCEMQWISQSEGLVSLSMSLVWLSMLEVEESSVEIMYESLEDMMRLPRVVILNIFLPVIWV